MCMCVRQSFVQSATSQQMSVKSDSLVGKKRPFSAVNGTRSHSVTRRNWEVDAFILFTKISRQLDQKNVNRWSGPCVLIQFNRRYKKKKNPELNGPEN